MDYISIIKRSWHITWNYKILWIFGILIALTAGGGNGSSNANAVLQSNGGGNGSPLPPEGFPFPNDFPEVDAWLIAAAIGLVCLAFIIAIVVMIVRYVSQASAIRMVDRYEDTGEKVGFRQGWRIGWSRAAFRLFLIDLLIGLAAVFVVILLLLLAASPLLLWLTQNETVGTIGTVAAIGLGVLVAFTIILAVIVLSLVLHFVKRAAVLENLGVIDSIRRGVRMVRRHLGDVIMMGLIMFGIGLGITVLMIPVIILFLAAGAIAGGLPALLVGWIASQFIEGGTVVVLAVLVGLPIFLTIVVLPALLFSGIFETFKWNVWTLTFRELAALEAAAPGGGAAVFPSPEGPASLPEA